MRTPQASCCSGFQKVRSSRLLHFSISSRTDRGAIRPYGSQNVTGVPKGVGCCNKMASLLYGLSTPLFLHTLHGSRICKKFQAVPQTPRLSNRSPKSQAKDRSKPPLVVGGIEVEIIFYCRTNLPQSLNTILFLFRSQETARFENGGQPAVTLEKSQKCLDFCSKP